MKFKKRQITALKPDGTEHTTTYVGWATLLCKNPEDIPREVMAMQKRMSVRNCQIKKGVEPYDMEEVTGTKKLKGQNRKRVKSMPRNAKAKAYKSQAMSCLHRGFLFRESARVVAALNSMELLYG